MSAKIVPTCIKLFLVVYDHLSFPFYLIFEYFSPKVKDASIPPAYLVKESSEEIVWRRDTTLKRKMYDEIINDHKVREIENRKLNHSLV